MPAPQVPDREDDVLRGARGSRWGRCDVATDDGANERGAGHLSFRHRGHDAPILEDRHGVAQRGDLIKAMGDVEDCDISVREFTDELEQSLRLSRGERRRGFVHRDQLGAESGLDRW